MTQVRQAVIVVCSIILCSISTGCSGRIGDWLARQQAWRIEHKELVALAGGNAKDCGYVRFGEDSTHSNSCALESIAKRKPFYVAYDVQGMDSHLIVGLVQNDSAQLRSVKYDSMGWEVSGVKPPQKVIGHIIIKPCLQPQPTLTPRGYLSCDLPKSW